MTVSISLTLAMRMSVAVFDRSGRVIEEHDQEGELYRRHLIAKHLFESLHPPILALASFFTAYSFEAGATHRALFLMPNSFVAQQRDCETGSFFQFCAAMLFLLPALAFAAYLSWRIDRDAASMGLSRRARRWWRLATFAFGLPDHGVSPQSRAKETRQAWGAALAKA